MDGSEHTLHRKLESERAGKAVCLLGADRDVARGGACRIGRRWDKATARWHAPPAFAWSERHASGETRPPIHFLSGVIALIVAVLLATSAFSSAPGKLTEVRVGAHSDFVRVVFESDAQLGATIKGPEDGVVEVWLPEAAASRPRLRDPGEDLKSLQYRREATAGVVSLKPAFDYFSIRRYRLSNPDRLVLELVPEDPPAPPPSAVKANVAAKRPWAANQKLLRAMQLGGVALVAILAAVIALMLYRRARKSDPKLPPTQEAGNPLADRIRELDEKIHSLLVEYRELEARRES